MTSSAGSILRFGVFEVNERLHELRKHGVQIRIQDQPLQILVLLLHRPGEVVAREEIRARLWPCDTFVDFDNAISSAVRKLREALSDTADNPRFIETLSRRGYRFIAPITVAPMQSIGLLGVQVAPPAGVMAESGDGRPRDNNGSSARTDKVRLLPQNPTSLAALAVVLIALAGVGWATWHGTHTRPDSATPLHIHSLAVLPLDNLSGDAEQEYFVDGMTAQLINDLAKIGSLRVISRTSAIRYKRTHKPMAQIARELDVDALVEGEVLRSQNQVRVTAQLIEAATDRHLWAETYQRDLRDVLNLQGELAQSIANMIQTKLTPEEHIGLAVSRPVNPEAYEAYLKGRYFWDKRTNEGLKKSIDYYQQAIAKDKYNALAYAGLAESYEFLRSDESPQGKEFEAKVKETVNKALELDNRLGEAHAVLARTMYFDWDWQGAEREFKRAIELSPGYATAHQRYSLLLMQMGRTEESLREIHLAQALDPLSLSISSSVGFRLLWARRYDQAINQLQKTLEMDPGFAQTHLYFGWIHEAKGETEKAIQEFRKATLAHNPHRVLASLGYVYALTGNTRQTQNILNQLQGHSTSAYPFTYDIAIVYAGLGKKDQAFEWLTKSCDERIWGISNLKVEPELDSLRSDPRFQDLLRRVGLPQ